MSQKQHVLRRFSHGKSALIAPILCINTFLLFTMSPLRSAIMKEPLTYTKVTHSHSQNNCLEFRLLASFFSLSRIQDERVFLKEN